LQAKEPQSQNSNQKANKGSWKKPLIYTSLGLAAVGAGVTAMVLLSRDDPGDKDVKKGTVKIVTP